MEDTMTQNYTRSDRTRTDRAPEWKISPTRPAALPTRLVMRFRVLWTVRVTWLVNTWITIRRRTRGPNTARAGSPCYRVTDGEVPVRHIPVGACSRFDGPVACPRNDG